MVDLKTRINEEMKAAMKAKDSERLSTIRMLMAAIKQREIDEQIKLDDGQVMATINKMIKQRQDAAGQFTAAGRHELADKENHEIEILKAFLPPALSEKEIDKFIAEAIAKANATNMKDMGKVMALLKPKIEGQADMGQVSAKLKAKLQ